MNKINDKIIIYADSREIKSRITSILKKRCKIEERRLDVADYLLSECVAAERKTCNDFFQSIIDGRLFRQLNELKNNFEKPIIIIEGDELFNNNRKIHPNAIRGALASIVIDFSIPILCTKNQLETAELLFAIAKREQLQTKRNIILRGKRKFKSMNQMQEFLVSGLPKISETKAKNLLKYFGTPEKIFTADEKELQKVEGIGNGLAKKIREILTKKYEKSILED
ncbi:MAG: ERCC4 domain-containing protein [Candidatus Aenigmatarchaeota archaeon]